MIDLVDTTSAEVAAALVEARRRSGSAGVGMVLTLMVVTEENLAYDALRAAMEASRQHPSRIITVIKREARSTDRLDAEIRAGEDAPFGEAVVLRLYGRLADHAGSVVLPLLLPDAPVVAWWPGPAPDAPAESPVGALAQRRITDAAAARKPLAALAERIDGHRPCDTDFAWTRITPWRSLLAAALDEPYDRVTSAEIAAERNNPSALLLAAWLGAALGIEVGVRASRGPGITSARLVTVRGDIAITRPDGHRATLSRPGQPDRAVALPRRTTTELLAEELRRLDDDEIYGETLLAARAYLPEPPAKPAARAAGARA